MTDIKTWGELILEVEKYGFFYNDYSNLSKEHMSKNDIYFTCERNKNEKIDCWNCTENNAKFKMEFAIHDSEGYNLITILEDLTLQTILNIILSSNLKDK
jgi:hypothetical protein